jgi:hypothetical protein
VNNYQGKPLQPHNIIHQALRSVLSAEQATDEERRQAELMLACLADLPEQNPARKLRNSELMKALCDSRADQSWRALEERHYDHLMEIGFRGSIDTSSQTELYLAFGCICRVACEIMLRKNQRAIDEMNAGET